MVYNNTEYSRFVEYGHRTQSGGRTKGARMMTSTYEDIKKELKDDVKKELIKRLK